MEILGFIRYEGSDDFAPQRFIDTGLPLCPMCGTTQPCWALKHHMGLVSRVAFKCEKCECILSATTGDISGIDRMGITSSGLLKAIKGKQANLTYIQVEAAGNAQPGTQYEGREMPLEELRQMAQILHLQAGDGVDGG